MEYLKSITLIAQALQEEAVGTGRAGPPPCPRQPPRPPMPVGTGVGALRLSLAPLPADGSEGVTPDTPKMLKLAEQCLERVKSIAAALGERGVVCGVPLREAGGPSWRFAGGGGS